MITTNYFEGLLQCGKHIRGWKSKGEKTTVQRLVRVCTCACVSVCVFDREAEQRGGRNVKHQQHSSASPCTACSTLHCLFFFCETLLFTSHLWSIKKREKEKEQQRSKYEV